MAPKLVVIGMTTIGTILLLALASIVIARVRRRRMIKLLEGTVAERRRITLQPQPLDVLPEPVQRYLRRACGNVPPAEWIELWQEGEFRTFSNPRWGKLRARALYTGTVPGMIWNAVVWYTPWQWYTIELLYAAGIGKGSMKLWNVVTLFDPEGPEANEALLTRVLMETVWFPMSLVPGGLLRWEPLNGNAARAILSDRGILIRADFYFTADGDVERIVTLDKYRDADTGFERDQCTMHCSDWREIARVRIPTSIRLEWNFPNETFEYMHLRVHQVRYR